MCTKSLGRDYFTSPDRSQGTGAYLSSTKNQTMSLSVSLNRISQRRARPLRLPLLLLGCVCLLVWNNYMMIPIPKKEILVPIPNNKTPETCPARDDPEFQKYVGFAWPQYLYSPPPFRKKSEGASAYPFLSHDIWAEVADKKRVFFMRPFDDMNNNMKELKAWLSVQPHPITLLMTNNKDASFPDNDIVKKEDWEDFIKDDKVKAIYTHNPRYWKEYPKVKPLPIGVKWQSQSTFLYGADKSDLHQIYSSVSTSPQQTKDLFERDNRTDTVWMRPMMSRRKSNKYDHDNEALNTPRSEIQTMLERNASKSTVAAVERMDQIQYFQNLQSHRFVISPVGSGLDSHATWEALLAGTVPILPHSPLDPMFEDLPVWLVNNWEEVTDESVAKKSKELRSRTYNWDKVFVQGWKDEIYSELCTLPSDSDGKPHSGVIGGNSWDAYSYGPDLADGQWPRSSFGVVKTKDDETQVGENIRAFIAATKEKQKSSESNVVV